MAEESFQERTEEATPRKREEAREKGQVPRSRDLSSTLVLLAGSGFFWMAGGNIVSALKDIMAESFTFGRHGATDNLQIVTWLADALGAAAKSLVPLFAAICFLAIAAHLAVGGFILSAEALSFKFERLNPMSGLKRIFSARGLMELVKSLLKFLVVASTAAILTHFFLDDLWQMASEPAQIALVHAGTLFVQGFFWLSFCLILVAAVDVVFQIWDHGKKLRMTRQELKEELRETEGPPELQQKIREMQRQAARRRMMAEVPKADVVVTNPMRFAVALVWEEGKMKAPKVLAKGQGEMARRIREIAQAHGVPVLEAPPLARALYFHAELEKEIPAGLYLAVAQVLAYVYGLKMGKRGEFRWEDGAVPQEFLEGRVA